MADIYRFFNTSTDVHFYTASAAERDSVLANLPQFNFEGVAFSLSTSEPLTAPVFRFLKNDGTHFYTISAVERLTLETSNPAYTFEAIAYSASTSQTAIHDMVLHRFFNLETGTHFYTASDAERDSIVDSLPNFRFEGTAYYVAGAPSVQFDEAFYLQAYPDLADAITLGSITSGQAHYTAFGQSEGRLAFDNPDLAGATGFDAAAAATNGFANGGAGDDTLGATRATAAPLRLYGETGDDVLHGLFAGDNLNGGSGNDFYVLNRPDIAAVEGLNGGTSDTASFTFSTANFSLSQFATPENVENLQANVTLADGVEVRLIRTFESFSFSGTGTVVGTNAAETFTVVGAAGGGFSTTLDAGAGDDTISASLGSVISGGAGADMISVSENAVASGGAGADQIIIDNGIFGIAGSLSSTVISGGADIDNFVINARVGARAGVFRGFGDNTITDFDGAAGEKITLGSANAADIPTVVSDVRDGVNGATVELTDVAAGNTYGGTITLTGGGPRPMSGRIGSSRAEGHV